MVGGAVMRKTWLEESRSREGGNSEILIWAVGNSWKGDLLVRVMQKAN